VAATANERSVGIVGVGSVGVAAAYALFTRRAVSRLLLVDKDAAKSEGVGGPLS
jgi:L-lactate dehydrogenase